MSNLTLVIANVSDANIVDVVKALSMGGYLIQMRDGVAGMCYVAFGSYPEGDVESCNFMRMLSMLARCGANAVVVTRAI